MSHVLGILVWVSVHYGPVTANEHIRKCKVKKAVGFGALLAGARACRWCSHRSLDRSLLLLEATDF